MLSGSGRSGRSWGLRGVHAAEPLDVPVGAVEVQLPLQDDQASCTRLPGGHETDLIAVRISNDQKVPLVSLHRECLVSDQ